MSARRTALAATLACLAGLAAAHTATDGFKAFTLESARRLNALRSLAPVPDLPLEFADGTRARLAEVNGRVLLVDFIYTQCPTLCATLGSVYAQLQRRLASDIAAGDARLVSISFDPGRDAPAELAAYRARYSATETGWALGRPADRAERQRWLDAFGVVAIPDGMGGYAHNAAIHVVGPDRRLAAIVAFDDIEGAVKVTRQVLDGRTADVAPR